jgi:uncharacterized protein
VEAKHHDITVVGAGVSSIFFAYTLMNMNKHTRIHMIDIGKTLNERACGLDEGKECTCNGICSKYAGFAGLGKSEGKFNYTNDFGGELHRKIGEENALLLMQEVDDILCRFGGEARKKYSTKNAFLSSKAKNLGLNVLSTEVRHLGSGLAQGIFWKMYEFMRARVTFTFETKVESIKKLDEGFELHTNRGCFKTSRIVIGTGMSGSVWLNDMMESFGVHPGETRLDMGYRVEMKSDQLQSILQDTFETKLKIEREDYEATTYCMNPHGRIIRKYQHGLVMADGQNALEKEAPSDNLNFTLFIPQYFPSYEEAFDEAVKVIGGINERKDRIVVQRLEDFKMNRNTETLAHNEVEPSLDAECGNGRKEVPALYADALLDFFDSLKALIGKEIHSDTLLYGLDAKFYEPKFYTNEYLESEIPGIYLTGDCSGLTHSLSQAAASGIYLGKHLRHK